VDSQYLINRIEDIEAVVAQIPMDLLQEDLAGLVVEVLVYVRKAIDLEELNRTLLAREHIDIETHRRVVDIIEALDLDGPHKLFPSRDALNPLSLLQDYRSFLDELAKEATARDSMNLALRLEFGSHSLIDLLLCAAIVRADLSEIVRIVREKLELLDDDQVISFWSLIQSEFNQDRSYTMEVDPDILPPDWLKTGSLADTKQKIADYVVVLKSRLMLSMFRAGKYTIPSEAASLSQILALSATAAATPVSQVELELARGLARLYSYWSRILNKPSNDFARFLGLFDNASFLDSRNQQEDASSKTLRDEDSARLILFELKKVVRAAYAFASYETPVEKALTQYKLGIEVMTPEIIKVLQKKKELTLQKELCKFLLERNVFAVGTKFGRSEVDLLAELPTEGYVIETKIYREGRNVGEGTIKNNLVQLQSYMDQSPVHRRGILVIYNFSSKLITAPKRWIGGRFWFLPINLQRNPPSGRHQSIMIDQGEGEDLVRIHNV